MDELEWLQQHSPSTRPSRDVTRRHRTQLRAAIATEGAEGARPHRPRRERRSRHRALRIGAAVVSVCAIGAGIIALAAGDGDDGSTVDAPALTDPSTTTAAPLACEGGPPRTLAIPAGFGNPVAGPATDAVTAPSPSQQVTTWSSDQVTIEQRWPADPDVAERYGPVVPSGDDSISGAVEGSATVDANGVVHRTMLFTFGARPPGCSSLQVTVYGRAAGTVDAIVSDLSAAPFRSSEPLVTTTGAAAAAPDVVACEGVTRPDLVARGVKAVATVGGPARGATYARAPEALGEFLAGRPTLAPTGYAELRLEDATVVYVKEIAGNVVTTVRVEPTEGGWTVSDWRASGC